MENKNIRMTYAMALNYAIASINGAEFDMKGFTAEQFVEKLEKLIAQQESKSKATPGKETAKEKQTADLREKLYNYMAERNELLTITDIMAGCPDFTPAPGMSTQRVSALMRGLLLANRVEKISEKNKSYFRAI